ncbi:DUF3472 domain-containing protein [Sphingobacterium sp. HMA12]|uniref:DUF3472 domain-containing protein n=1 Tax=Sphingobacterium sp. HMA12 TaxID=2050894 RepID=UPI000CEA47D8|nr:DUF5077 domain-containing protein [Sphingobacterium sp. HMA12]
MVFIEKVKMTNLFNLLGILSVTGLLFFSCGKSHPVEDTPIGITGKKSLNVIQGGVNDLTVAIPMGGNSFVTNGLSGAEIFDNSNYGLRNWTSLSAVVSTYFKVTQSGTLHLGIKGYVTTGSSVVRLTVNGQSFDVAMTGGAPAKDYYAGSVEIATPGYVKVDLQAVSKTATYIGNMTDILIGGTAASSGLTYANIPTSYYFSRRGPSVHLVPSLPTGNSYEWMYNEVIVPAGQDPVGSYYMANGFGQGYFGFQVNSATQRKIIFSVWDPSKESDGKTTVVSNGTDVAVSGFGGEGTGGKSNWTFNWSTETTYKFLTRIRPDGLGNTLYSSWFYAPELGTWKYIATFKRPAISTYITGAYSFLENFNNTMGYLGRKAYYSNFWVRSTTGTWIESTSCRFSVDGAGDNNQRGDYKGGVENGRFFLQNGGFFNDLVAENSVFTRPAIGTAPNIDLNNLPIN